MELFIQLSDYVKNKTSNKEHQTTREGSYVREKTSDRLRIRLD